MTDAIPRVFNAASRWYYPNTPLGARCGFCCALLFPIYRPYWQYKPNGRMESPVRYADDDCAAKNLPLTRGG